MEAYIYTQDWSTFTDSQIECLETLEAKIMKTFLELENPLYEGCVGLHKILCEEVEDMRIMSANVKKCPQVADLYLELWDVQAEYDEIDSDDDNIDYMELEVLSEMEDTILDEIHRILG